MTKKTQKLVPFLWYAKEAEEAASFYASIFPDSRVDRVVSMQSESPSGPAPSRATSGTASPSSASSASTARRPTTSPPRA